jgi:hypothetical protein
VYRGGDLSTKGRDLSIERETRLLSGGDSSTKGETLLRRDRLVYRGGD